MRNQRRAPLALPNVRFKRRVVSPRQRAIQMLRDAGQTVVETILSYADFRDADEIFSAGNFAKLAAITVERSHDFPYRVLQWN